MKTLKAFNVQIWCGLKEQYSDVIHPMDDVRKIVDEFVNEIKDCVTITPTEFRYVDGSEPGFIIGWIQYPRFPRKKDEIQDRSLLLARRLMRELGQYKVTITTPHNSIMIENETIDCTICNGTGVCDNDGYNLPCPRCRSDEYTYKEY